MKTTKKKKKRDQLLIVDANKIVPIKTEISPDDWNFRLRRMTGDKKRYPPEKDSFRRIKRV
tara:strand:+ start:340 stop:522 length:183 start_codon:yes stop_codon:yes gene_type:complete